MFPILKYRFQLYKLGKSSRKLSKQYKQADIRITNKGQEDYMELQDLSRQQDELQTWIDFLKTN